MFRRWGTKQNHWVDKDPWLDMAAAVSRDIIVRKAIVRALKSTSEISLASVPLTAEYIQDTYGLGPELAAQGLALHAKNLRTVYEEGYPPGVQDD